MLSINAVASKAIVYKVIAARCRAKKVGYLAKIPTVLLRFLG